MVDLPGVPRRLALANPPESSVSPREVSSLYHTIGQGIADAGQAAQAVLGETPEEAKARGYLAATSRDGNGNLVVGPAPSLLDGKHYADGWRAGRLAEISGEMQRVALDLRQKFPDDPVSFERSMEEARRGLVSRERDPVIQAGIQQYGERYQRETSLGIQREKFAADTQVAEQRLLAERKRLDMELGQLAAQGGTETPEYRQRLADLLGIDEQLANPLFRRDRRALEISREQMSGRHRLEAAAGAVDRLLEAGDFVGARKLQSDVLNNPNLGSQEERRTIHNVIQARISRATAARRSEVHDFRQELATVLPDIGDGHAEPQQVDDLIARAKAIGDGVSYIQLQRHRWWGEQNRTLRGLPLDQRRAFQRSIVGGLNPRMAARVPAGSRAVIEQVAAKEGVDPNYMTVVAAIESGGDPGQVTGSYKGLFQMSDAEMQKWHPGGNVFDAVDNATAAARKIKAEAAEFEKDFGRAPRPVELYLLHQQGEAGLRAHLRNPDAPAWANMLSTGEGKEKGERWAKQAIWGNVPNDVKARFGSVENVTSADFIALWEAKVGGGLGGMVMPGTDPDQRPVGRQADGTFAPVATAPALGSVRTRRGPNDPATIFQRNYAKQVEADWPDIRKTILSGVDPPEQVIAAFLQDASVADLSPKVVDDIYETLAARGVWGEIKHRTAAERQAAVEHLRGGAGNLPVGGRAAILEMAEKQDQRLREAKRTGDILSVAEADRAVPRMPDLDFNDPAGSLAKRAAVMPFLREWGGVEGVSYLRQSEATALRQFWADADSAQKARLVANIASAIPHKSDFQATMRALVSKDDKSDRDMGVFAIAADAYRNDPKLAQDIVAGEAALGPSRDPPVDVQKAFDETIGNSLRMNDPMRRAFQGAAFALATARQLRQGAGGKVEPEAMRAATKEVIGGFVESGGQRIPAPERGMTQAQFNKAVAAIDDTMLLGAIDRGGRPLTVDVLRRSYRLVPIGGTKFLLSTGAIGADKFAASDPGLYGYGDMQDFVLDLAPAIEKAKRGNWPGSAPPAPGFLGAPWSPL